MLVDVDLNDIDQAIKFLMQLKNPSDTITFTKISDDEKQKTEHGYVLEVSVNLPYKNREAAEKASDVYRRFHRLYTLAEELNPPGWELNKTEVTGAYVLVKNIVDGYSKHHYTYPDFVAGVYFASSVVADKAIEILEQEELF